MVKKGRKRTNIGEVAHKAGVSKMTVSRMLNNVSKVAPATRVRVQKVMDDLYYHPNPFARGLASQKSGILGLMISEGLGFDFFMPMFQGIEEEARANGFDLLIFSHPDEKLGQDNRSLALVDGILCFGNIIDNNIIENLEDREIPYAVIGKREWRRVSPWYCAGDYYNGFLVAAKYLLNLGHKKIAFLGGSSSFIVDAEKHEGYRHALKEAGITNILVLCDTEISSLREALDEFRPTAVLMESVVFPMPFLLYAKEKKLRIPDDISVIYTRREFIDVHTLYNLTGIHELTLINIPRRELGIAGVRMLHSLIKGEKNIPKEQKIKMKLIAGESCAPLRLKKSLQRSKKI